MARKKLSKGAVRRKPAARGGKAKSKKADPLVARGADFAARVFEARGGPVLTKRAKADKGLLVFEGDSWFDYPVPDSFFSRPTDLVCELRKRGYGVRSVSHYGHTLEGIAYHAGQLSAFIDLLEDVRQGGKVPKAIMLSGGGNDLAGELFEVVLEHALSGSDAVNESVLHGIVDVRLRNAVRHWIGAVDKVARELFGKSVPILTHGYAYAVPDGRGVLGKLGLGPGPWLAPGFRAKGYADGQLAANRDVMKRILDRLNKMLSDVAHDNPLGNGRFHYVDLRQVLPDNAHWKTWWSNELHPTKRGFSQLAATVEAAIEAAAKP